MFSNAYDTDLDLAPFIDHALLHPTATPEAVDRCCDEADRFGFASVCLAPVHVPRAVERLHRRKPVVCTVVGFPTGATTSAVKLYEAQEAIEAGAAELDAVLNLGWLRTGMAEAVHRELAQICEVADGRVKAILEVGLLTPAELDRAVDLCLDAGVAYLKTHTGWNGGATPADVKALHARVRGRAGIKAAGGIRTAAQALELIAAGASRLGTSRGPALIAQMERGEGGGGSGGSGNDGGNDDRGDDRGGDRDRISQRQEDWAE